MEKEEKALQSLLANVLIFKDTHVIYIRAFLYMYQNLSRIMLTAIIYKNKLQVIKLLRKIMILFMPYSIK